jgi:hypothetical protein
MVRMETWMEAWREARPVLKCVGAKHLFGGEGGGWETQGHESQHQFY